MTDVGVPPRLRLVDAVYGELRGAILRGVLAPGTPLKAASLATELQVSRGPVRLALQRLASEGMVVERPHTSAIVRELSTQDVVDLQNTRIGLERIAFALATRAAIDTAELSAMVSEAGEQLGAASPMEQAQHELAFHQYVASRCGNEMLMQLFEGISGLIAMACVRSAPGHWHQRMIDDHLVLIQAIASGDDHAAAAHAARHVSALLPADDEDAQQWRHLLLAD